MIRSVEESTDVNIMYFDVEIAEFDGRPIIDGLGGANDLSHAARDLERENFVGRQRAMTVDKNEYGDGQFSRACVWLSQLESLTKSKASM